MHRGWFLASLGLLVASPLAAAPRDLPVPADKGWQHADTGLILPATLDGLQRRKLADNTASERDIDAEFATPDRSVDASLFLFHPAIDDVALWFDRAQAAIRARELFGGVSAASLQPTGFAPPGRSVASALRQSYTAARRPVRGTALAMIPLGDWLLAVRVSSTTQDAAAVSARMDRILAAIRWPKPVPEGRPATPVAACGDALRFDAAKPAPTQAGDALMALVMGSVAQHAKPNAAAEPVRWCRDSSSTPRYGVYRASGAGYQIALGDAGRVMHVTPTLDTQLGKASSYSVSLTDVDDSVKAFPSFTGLPRPDQVVALLGSSVASATSTGNETRITLAPR